MIRFADGRHVTSTRRGNIVVIRRDGQKTSITDVLYVSFTISSLINIGQLLAKGYNMKVEENQLKMYNGERKMITKSPLEDNKTFKIKIDMVDHQCLASTVVEDKNWLWHHRYGHLNFKGICILNQKKIIYGLTQVKEPNQVCEECFKAKQARKAFKHDLSMKLREKLVLVHYDVCVPFEVRSNGGNLYFLSFIDEFAKYMWITVLKRIVGYLNSSRCLNCMSRNNADAS